MLVCLIHVILFISGHVERKTELDTQLDPISEKLSTVPSAICELYILQV